MSASVSLEVSPEMEASAQRFISSLSKSIQALCHGCLDWDNSIEIMGYINVNIDQAHKLECVLGEAVKKGSDNSMTFGSDSFVAKIKKSKKTELREASCSPIPETFYTPTQTHNPYPQYPPVPQRGAHKRQWSSGGRDWRASQMKKRKSSSHNTSYSQQSFQQSAPSTPTNSSYQQQNTNSSSAQSDINIKQEAVDFPDGIEGVNSSGDRVNIKPDPDAAPSSEGGLSENQSTGGSSFNQPNKFDSYQGGASNDSNNFDQGGNSSNSGVGDGAQKFDSNSDLPVSFGEGGSGETGAYHDSSYGGEGGDDTYECIEIGDDEEEEFQAMFGDERIKQQPSTQRGKISLMPTMSPQDFPNNFLTLPMPKNELTSLKQRGYPDYQCGECGRTFHEQWRLRRHQLTHLGLNERPVHHCPVEGCNRKYYQPESLGRHLKSHHSVFQQ